LRNFTASDSQVQVKLKTLENCDLLKASPSPDRASFAAVCAKSTQLLIGDLLKMEADMLAVDMPFTVEAFRWHPQTNTIAVAGTNQDDNTFHLVLYDVDKKEINDCCS
jgi:hypothetical protein